MEVEFNGFWYAATVDKRVPSGVRVRFDEDEGTTLIPNGEIASRMRGAGVEQLSASEQPSPRSSYKPRRQPYRPSLRH